MSGLATVDHADIEWESDGTPRSRQFNDVYFSRDGGLDESTYVYLQGNGIPERWPAHFQSQQSFHLFEAGFGTGLNFLLTLRAFLNTELPTGGTLHYVAVECFPMQREDLTRALAVFPELAEFAAELLEQYPPAIRGWHLLHFAQHRVELLLIYDAIAHALPQLLQTDWRFDAWYLDGFAPARNEAMWAETLWPAIQQLARDHATASTFSAAGAVRRGLQSADFQVEKYPGFGRKRDMTRAIRSPSTSSRVENNVSRANNCDNSIVIIGAGIAGAISARMLAEHGLSVTVIERNAQAGGTLQHHTVALASPRWSRDHNSRSQLQLIGLLSLLRWCAQLDADADGTGSIVLHRQILTLLENAELQREHAVLAELGLLGHFAHALSATEASERAGIELTHPAIEHQLAIAVDPHVLCQRLLQHPRITIRYNTTVQHYHANTDGWQLELADRKSLHTRQLLLATGAESRGLLPELPLRPVRGQSTTLPQTAVSAALRLPLRFGGYVCPARDNVHTLGASYDGGVIDVNLRSESQQQNLDALAWALPSWAAHWRDQPLTGDVGHRLVTPDRAPLIGPHPHKPGLWLNLAHGSHALMTACAGAQMLVDAIMHRPTSVPPALLRAVAPSRFLR